MPVWDKAGEGDGMGEALAGQFQSLGLVGELLGYLCCFGQGWFPVGLEQWPWGWGCCWVPDAACFMLGTGLHARVRTHTCCATLLFSTR